MIRILDDQVVNRIAAGEVVERPASVVKELVENALDAGALRIDVNLKGGGAALVRVSDDGSGMDRQDALLCLERHATSKIRSETDLVGVATLGFRGEAIPSIASVSRFTLTTRRRDDEVGTKLKVDGGKLLGVESIGCAVGTVIEVRELFGNVPARRKFLRSAATELAHALEAVQRVALGRPDVDFRVTHDDRDVLVAPAGDVGRRIRDVIGPDARGMLPIEFEDSQIKVEGLIGPPGVHRGESTGAVYMYVNGRFVRDAVVRRGLNDAMKAVLPRGRHPVAVLRIEVPPDRVDVNVHPAKIEVRFRDPWDVERVVAEAVRMGLGGGSRQMLVLEAPEPTPMPTRLPVLPLAERPKLAAHPDDDPRVAREGAVGAGTGAGSAVGAGVGTGGETRAEPGTPAAARIGVATASEGGTGPAGDPEAPEGSGSASEGAPGARSAGDVGADLPVASWSVVGGFAVGVGADALWLVDLVQARAAGWARSLPEAAVLATPIRVGLGPAQVAWLSSVALAELGVELIALGPTAVAVRAAPAGLSVESFVRLIAGRRDGSRAGLLRAMSECWVGTDGLRDWVSVGRRVRIDVDRLARLVRE